MSYPTQEEIELPLLEVIANLGGSSPPSKIYELLAEYFALSSNEMIEKTGVTGANKWETDVRFARAKLIEEGYLEPISVSGRNNWAISANGRELLQETDEIVQEIYDANAE